MRRDYFVTGTDTGVGKTLVSAALLRALRDAGHRVGGMKPVAAGVEAGPEGPANADALLLQSESSVRLPYAVVNPCLYEPAIAPHIAAAETGVAIDTDRILAALEAMRSATDVVIAEGAGGFLVPLDASRFMADLPKLLGMDVILVVGLRLGCLSHALLTAEAIAARGLTLAGWIGNGIDPKFARREANLEALESRIPAPCLGVVPWMANPSVETAAAHLRGALRLRRIPLE